MAPLVLQTRWIEGIVEVVRETVAGEVAKRRRARQRGCRQIAGKRASGLGGGQPG
jgi:hypothetical protein